MNKFSKIIIIGWLSIMTLLALILFIVPRNNEKAAAQVFPEKPICDEIIPVGGVIEESVDLMDEIYKEYTKTRQMVDLAIEQVQAEVADLYREPGNPKGVCDFSVCKPSVVDRAPELGLKATICFPMPPPLKPKCFPPINITNIHLPACQAYACLGQPCADLDKYESTINSTQEAIINSWQVVHAIFASTSVAVTEEIRKKEAPGAEAPGAYITRAEAVVRKLKLVREWLRPSAEAGKKSCAMSELEREKVEAGEIGARFPMRCVEALESQLYWPRTWSETCQDQCKDETDEDCARCLADTESNSFLGKINHKLFNTCRTQCLTEQGLTAQCQECLCTVQKTVGGQILLFPLPNEITITTPYLLSTEECQAFLCGGNYSNWTCCHEAPLEGPSQQKTCKEENLPTIGLRYGYPADYSPKRLPELETLLTCIAGKVKQRTTGLTADRSGYDMPNEAENNDFYGSIFTWDHDNSACNYTRGNPVCSPKCSHSRYSCHYGGAIGAGAMAVDFGTNFINHRETIMLAATECVKEEYKRQNPSLTDQRAQELADAFAVNKILNEDTHLHISLPDCSITGEEQE